MKYKLMFVLCMFAVGVADAQPVYEAPDVIEYTCTDKEVQRYLDNGWDAIECDWDKTEVMTAGDKLKHCPDILDEYAADAFSSEFLNWCQAARR
jgi:hypothetical protein